MPNKPAYDLLVLIDADVPEERRGQILDAIRKQIADGDSELKGDVDWGVRKLTFEIAHRPDAYYHLFQLEAGPELLKELGHSLAIDDAVLRHRIIRLPKGVPDRPPQPAPSPSAPRAPQTMDEGSAPEAAATPEPAASPEPAAAAEPAAAPEPAVAVESAAAPQEPEASDSPSPAPQEESQPAT